MPEQPDVLQRLEGLQVPPRPPLGFVPELLPRRSALGGDSPLGNLTADALRAASGADVVLFNSSGLRGDLEDGLLIEPDLDLALPFAEDWFSVWLSGKGLKQGLVRGARRSAARQCESAVQVSGLKLRVDCAACRGVRADCLEVLRPGLLGDQPLRDDELVSLSLPAYLTLEGADFEGLRGSGGSVLPVSAREALARHIAQLPRTANADACAESLVGLSRARCLQAFGAGACPIDAQHAASFCRAWPYVVGGRDERIQMLP